MPLTPSDIRKFAKLGASMETVAFVMELLERCRRRETHGNAPPIKRETRMKRGPSVSSTERVRKYRQKLKMETPNETRQETVSPVSETTVSPTPPSSSSYIEPVSEEVLKEKSKELPITRERAKKLDTRIPEDFVPDETCERLARELHYTRGLWNAVLAEFKDYWVGTPGSKGMKRDWQATFRNKLRHEAKRAGNGNAKGNGHGTQYSNRSSIEQAIDHIDRREEGADSGGQESGNDDLRLLS